MTPESFKQVIPDPFLIMILWTLVSLWLGTYRKRPVLSAVQAFGQAIESDIIACALAVIVTFFSLGANDIARSFILLFGPISLPLLGLSFYFSVFITMTIERHWTEPKRIAVVGDGDDARSMIETIQKSAVQSLQFAGLILPEAAIVSADNPPGNHEPACGSDQP
jgi:FlaA1/EpsC-like NDP-sugar epimerase